MCREKNGIVTYDCYKVLSEDNKFIQIPLRNYNQVECETILPKVIFAAGLC